MSYDLSSQTVCAFQLRMSWYYQQSFNSSLWINDTFMTNYVTAFSLVEYREFIYSFWLHLHPKKIILVVL